MYKRIAQSCIALSAPLALWGLLLAPAFGMNNSAQLDEKKPADTAAAVPAHGKHDGNAPVMFFDRSGADRASIHLQILQQTSTHFADCSGDKKGSGSEGTETGGVLKPVANSYKKY